MNKDSVELQILILQYEREVSKAHTIFSSFCDVFFGISVGALGLVIALKQASIIDFNKFDFILMMFITFSIIGAIGITAFYFWWETRVARGNIEIQLNKINSNIN